MKKKVTKKKKRAASWRSGDRDLQINRPVIVTLELAHDESSTAPAARNSPDFILAEFRWAVFE